MTGLRAVALAVLGLSACAPSPERPGRANAPFAGSAGGASPSDGARLFDPHADYYTPASPPPGVQSSDGSPY